MLWYPLPTHFITILQVNTIVTTSWSLLAGDRDGTVTMLAIVDPQNKEKSGIHTNDSAMVVVPYYTCSQYHSKFAFKTKRKG